MVWSEHLFCIFDDAKEVHFLVAMILIVCLANVKHILLADVDNCFSTFTCCVLKVDHRERIHMTKILVNETFTVMLNEKWQVNSFTDHLLTIQIIGTKNKSIFISSKWFVLINKKWDNWTIPDHLWR